MRTETRQHGRQKPSLGGVCSDDSAMWAFRSPDACSTGSHRRGGWPITGKKQAYAWRTTADTAEGMVAKNRWGQRRRIGRPTSCCTGNARAEDDETRAESEYDRMFG